MLRNTIRLKIKVDVIASDSEDDQWTGRPFLSRRVFLFILILKASSFCPQS